MIDAGACQTIRPPPGPEDVGLGGSVLSVWGGVCVSLGVCGRAAQDQEVTSPWAQTAQVGRVNRRANESPSVRPFTTVALKTAVSACLS